MSDAITRLARPEILSLTPYSSARVESGAQPVVIPLDANESPLPPYPGGPAQEGLNRYPDPQPPRLRARLAALLATTPERLLITRGADEAIDLLVRAFCSAGRDGIVICPPTFGMYEVAARIQGASVRSVPLRAADGFQLDLDGVVSAQRADPGLKLVFVCSPNNPTGGLLRRDDVLALAAALEGRALVVVDHAYIEFSGAAPLSDAIDEHENLVVLRTLSKAHALAGERIGAAVASESVIEILGRILAPYPLAASAIAAAEAALTPDGVDATQARIAAAVAERERVARALRALPGVHVHHSDANFLLVDAGDPAALLSRMGEAGVKVRDRSAVPGIEGCVRISIGTPEQNDVVLSVVAAHAEARAVAR